jgi:hypothetical protein
MNVNARLLVLLEKRQKNDKSPKANVTAPAGITRRWHSTMHVPSRALGIMQATKVQPNYLN